MSMDGASVNWAFLKEIQKHHEQEELPQLIQAVVAYISFMGHFKQVQLLHAGILKLLLKLYTSYYMIVLHIVQIILVSQELRYFHSRFVLQGGQRTTKLLIGQQKFGLTYVKLLMYGKNQHLVKDLNAKVFQLYCNDFVTIIPE